MARSTKTRKWVGSSLVDHADCMKPTASTQGTPRMRMMNSRVDGESNQTRWSYCSAGRGCGPWRYCRRTGNKRWYRRVVLGIPENRSNWTVPRCESDGPGSVTKMG